MSLTTNYWKYICGRAREETTLFARNKLLIGGTIALVGLFFQGMFGLHPWRDLGKILLTIGGSYALVVTVAYLQKALSLPAVINDKQKGSISDLNNQIAQLDGLLAEALRPEIDPAEQSILSEVQAALDKLSPLEKSVLRQVSINNGRQFGGEPLKQLAAKMKIESKTLMDMLNALATTLLLNYENNHMTQIYWEIPAGYRDAIRKLV